MKHNMVKKTNWGEANQLAIYKRSRRIYNSELLWNKSMKWLEWGLTPGLYKLKVQHPNHSAMLPRLLTY